MCGARADALCGEPHVADVLKKLLGPAAGNIGALAAHSCAIIRASGGEEGEHAT